MGRGGGVSGGGLGGEEVGWVKKEEREGRAEKEKVRKNILKSGRGGRVSGGGGGWWWDGEEKEH